MGPNSATRKCTSRSKQNHCKFTPEEKSVTKNSNELLPNVPMKHVYIYFCRRYLAHGVSLPAFCWNAWKVHKKSEASAVLTLILESMGKKHLDSHIFSSFSLPAGFFFENRRKFEGTSHSPLDCTLAHPAGSRREKRRRAGENTTFPVISFFNMYCVLFKNQTNFMGNKKENLPLASFRGKEKSSLSRITILFSSKVRDN